jgi:AcrR family transcriptional regulator
MTRSPLPARTRPRGRPRAGSGEDGRELILTAATDEFNERGYDGASMRSVARRAGVDPALVHHYFDSKAALLSEVIGAPLRIDQEVARALQGPRDQIGERLARWILTAWDEPATAKRGALILRSAIGNKLATPIIRQFISREVLGRIAHELGTQDAEFRATMAATQIIGLLVARYIVQLDAVASASIEELVARIGPVLQFHLVDSPGDPILPMTIDNDTKQENNSSHGE